MKKLDLNLGLKFEVPQRLDGKPVTNLELMIYWLRIAVENTLNKTDNTTGIAKVGSKQEVQRRYNNLFNAVDKNENGIVTLEDEDFSFLDSKFNQHELPVQRNRSKILVALGNAINKAKVK